MAADRTVRMIDDEGSPPLGIGLGAADRTDSTVVLPPGATLVLYTDGLIERRGETIDDGFDRLVTRLASCRRSARGLV